MTMRLNYERGLQRLGKVAGVILGGWVFLFCEAFGIAAVFTYERNSELYLGIGLIIFGFMGAAGTFYLVRWAASILLWMINGFIDTEDDTGDTRPQEGQ